MSTISPESTQAPRTRRSGPARLGVVLAVAAAAVLAVGAGVLQAPSAGAAGSATGWVRVGHLSPDTKSVDVRLTALAGGQVAYELDDVTYGQVSPYKRLPVGTYSVSMVPAGAAVTSTPVISASVTVASGKPITVVAYGKNADLKTTVFEDDLTKPAADKARIRLVQAATVSKSVSVETTTGTPIAENAPYGSASGYASVDAGKWTLDLQGKKKASTATKSLTLASGSINTLFILDNSKGGITIVPAVDSAATTTTPKGGVQTGGGYEATHAGLDLVGPSAALFPEFRR